VAWEQEYRSFVCSCTYSPRLQYLMPRCDRIRDTSSPDPQRLLPNGIRCPGMPWCNMRNRSLYSRHHHRNRRQGYPASSNACDICTTLSICYMVRRDSLLLRNLGLVLSFTLMLQRVQSSSHCSPRLCS
jgi:hypothetical protein